MQHMIITEHFTGIAAKRLTAVEADPDKSHQHEFNGVKGLVQLFGKMEFGERKEIATVYIYLSDEAEEITRIAGSVTWYESRKQPRSEHRLYYHGLSVIEKSAEGDLVVFAQRPDGSLMLIIAKSGSIIEKQILWLFSLSAENLEKIEYKDFSGDRESLGFAESIILEELGLEAVRPDDAMLSDMLEKFEGVLPSTYIFSAYARSLSGVDFSTDDPDKAIVCWVQKEEELFRAFERYLVSGRLKQGFGKNNDDVDAFIEFSLSVHNRRKSRMGKSFENHLEKVFIDHGLRYSKGPKTERKRTPDFLFPDIDSYRNPSFPEEKLTMLGAKSTCKERWAQVLNEADRISRKHLVTLEPSITEDQTDEMESSMLQLVVPTAIHDSYTSKQRDWLMNLKQFISLVEEKHQVLNLL